MQGAGEAFEDMKRMGLSGEGPLGEVKTKAPNSDFLKNSSSVAARQAEVGRGYLKRVYCHRAQEVQRGPGVGLRDGCVLRDAGARELHL